MESEVLWNRYNAMLVFHSILISSIGFIFTQNSSAPNILSTVLPIVGLVSCYLWYVTTSRGFQWLHYWLDKTRELEKDGRLGFGPMRKSKIHNKYVIGSPTTQHSATIIIIMVAIIYIIILANNISKSHINRMGADYRYQKIFLNTK